MTRHSFWLRRAWIWQTRLFGCIITRISSRIQSSPRSSTTTIRNIRSEYSRRWNQEGEQFYLRSWYSLAQKISRECQLKAYEGYKPKEQMTYVNIYLLVYAAMKSLKNGSLSRIMANIEHDSDKIGNLAFYFFTYILEVLEMPLG